MKKTLRALIPLLFALPLLLGACAGLAATPAVDEAALAATVEARVISALEARDAAAEVDAAELAAIAGPADTSDGAELAEEAVAAALQNDDSLLALEQALIDVYAAANPAVVYVVVPQVSTGSGFLYSADGYIVTNNHVVAGGDTYEIVFAGGERRSATLVGADEDSDLAVLQVDDVPAGITPLPLANLEGLQVGELVVAIGNPFGEQGSMSLGIVSALGRSLPSQRSLGNGGSYSLPAVIQTDAPINPGNSGGPLLNLDGEVVGITSAIVSASGTNSGVGYSIPVDAVRQIVPSLIADGSYTYPYVGASFDPEISLAEEALYGLDQTQGTYVISVLPGSPAAEAGLTAADPTTGEGGDLVIAIDGRPVANFGEMNAYLVFSTSVGQTIELTVLRGGDTITLPLTLGARP